MQVIAVDERTNCQERHDPCFRVYLHESGGDTTFGAVATYDITGADVLQVIDWAQTQAEGWSRATGGARPTYAIAYVPEGPATSDLDRRTLVWLLGVDGNDSVQGEQLIAQRRMLQRRTDPVGIPEADRARPGPPPPSTESNRPRGEPCASPAAPLTGNSTQPNAA